VFDETGLFGCILRGLGVIVDLNNHLYIDFMNLWERIKQTIYRPDFFVHHSYRVGSGLKFYSLLLLFFIGLRVLLALPATVQFYQTILSDAWERQEAIVTDLFPEELRLSVNDGIVSTNVTEPYAIPMPQEWRALQGDMPENLVVINTLSATETDDFARADTLIIIGRDSVGFHNANKGEFRIYDLSGRDGKWPVSVDRQAFAEFVATTSDVVRWVLIIGGIALPFILYAVLWIVYLVYLVFGALVIWAGAKWRGHQITYGDAYVAGMFLFPIPFLYEFLSSYGQGLAGNIPFAFTLLLLVMTLLNFQKITPVSKEISEEAASEKKATE
jgi:hypothetical protein